MNSEKTQGIEMAIRTIDKTQRKAAICYGQGYRQLEDNLLNKYKP